MIKNTFTNSIIAEIGSVHDGSFGNACNLVTLAKECGANIVKFQTHLAEYETIKNAPMPNYFKGEPRYDYFERTSFSKKKWDKLKKYCDENQIEFLSSPFSIEAAELLNDIGINKFKVPSGEVTNTPLLEKLASIGKPVILSSGAKFIVVICGSIMTMPGLPKIPAADKIKLNKKGQVEGLF